MLNLLSLLENKCFFLLRKYKQVTQSFPEKPWSPINALTISGSISKSDILNFVCFSRDHHLYHPPFEIPKQQYSEDNNASISRWWSNGDNSFFLLVMLSHVTLLLRQPILGKISRRHQNKAAIFNFHYFGISRQSDCIGFQLCEVVGHIFPGK